MTYFKIRTQLVRSRYVNIQTMLHNSLVVIILTK
uniref:Uncharacterized protein n=1 Tax=Arundo donax TaxID=35708 RepID=A0A0A9HTE2_ARUDO